MCPLRKRWTMVTSWSRMVWRNWSMHIAQCLGCRVLGVNLTHRWVTHHTASCPLAVEVGCVLPSCVQGSAEPVSRVGSGEINLISVWGLVLLVSVLLVNTWIHNRGRHRHSRRRPSHLAGHFPSRGRARWVGGRRWRRPRRCHFPKSRSFYFTFSSFWG